MKLSESTVDAFGGQMKNEVKALSEALGKVQTERSGLKDEAIGEPDNAFIKQEEERLDREGHRLDSALSIARELLEQLEREPSPFCVDCSED